jgi:hypothetical protein
MMISKNQTSLINTQQKENMAKYSPSGYIARNQHVAAAYGIKSGLLSIRKRMQQRKDCPLWLLEMIDECLTRSTTLIRPLIDHRDELTAYNDKSDEIKDLCPKCGNEWGNPDKMACTHCGYTTPF